MTLTRAIAIAIIAASSSLGYAHAQNISSVQAPAEFPPASYSGRQYVDSNGCVFVRAGIDGNVSWVPRVSRDRKVICGFQPSLPGGGGTQLAQTPQQADEPVQITVAQPSAAATPEPAAAPAKKPVVVAQPKPATQPVLVQVPQRTAPVTQPTIIRVKPAAQPVPKTVTIATAPAPQPAKLAPRQSACKGASSVSAKYLRNDFGHAVRCGPQADFNIGVILGGEGRTAANTAPAVANTAYTSTYAQPAPLKRSAATHTTVRRTPNANSRWVTRNVYENQLASTIGVYIPPGYAAAWNDDRLNTRRAHFTYPGRAQMELRWTNTVPRRLIEVNTGKEVRYLFPDLHYPNTSYDQQIIAGVTVSTKGAVRSQQTLYRQTANKTRDSLEAGPQPTMRIAGTSASAPATRSSTHATISTRSVTVQPKAQPAAQTQARDASHRYVQAARYGDLVRAKRDAQRLANAGLPTRLGKRTRNGQISGAVVLGPFATQGQLKAALQKVRNMGFGGAFLRN